MGPAINAFGDTVTLLRDTPKVFAIGAGAYFGGVLLYFVVGWIPLLGQLAGICLLAGLLAGMIGTCRSAGANGDVSISDFTSTAMDNLPSLAGAWGILFGAVLTVEIVLFLLLLIAGGPRLMFGLLFELGVSGFFGLFGLVVLLIGLVSFAVSMVVQFLDVSVVLGGESATSAFGRSLYLVLSAPLSVLGYTILRGITLLVIVYGPFVAVFAVVLGAGAIGIDASVLTLLAIPLGLIVAPVAFTFQMAYHTVYFARRQRA